MVGIKNNRRTQYTKELIKSNFLELLDSKKMPQITVTEICSRADLNRGILEEGGNPCAAEESMVRLLEAIRDKKTLYRMLISEKGKDNFLSQVLGGMYETYWSGAEKSSAGPDYAFTYRVYGSLGVINQWLEADGEEEPQTISRLISSFGHL